MNSNSEQVSSSESSHVLTLTQIGNPSAQWTLGLFPTHLALSERPGSQPYIILRDQVMRTATLVEGMRAFALQVPIKTTFNLTPEATAILAEWIGKPVLAAVYLKRRYGWILPIAILWILGSLPIRGNPEAGVAAVPFDAIAFVLGSILVVSWAFAKWRPHPVLFLIDSMWFVAMGGHLVMTVVNGRSKGWLVLVLLLVWMVINGLKHFMRFKNTKIVRWDPRGVVKA